MPIPILDLHPEIEALREEINAAIQEVLHSTQFIMGPNVKAFEEEAAAYLGARHAVAVNSGTDALIIALRAAGIRPGDEVITTPFTFFATAEAISLVGAVPVFADIEPRSFNIDPERVRAAITPRTRAVLPVHLYGQAAEMDPLLELARAHDLVIIEDVAQAFGGEYKGRKLGTLGLAGCFSFYPSKNLGAYGDGGLITTDDDRLAELARMLRIHGSRQRYYHEFIGYNSRLDEFQAAILRVKLPRVDEWNERRREAARRYGELLAGLPGVITPCESPHARHVYHQYTIRITGGKRDAVQRHLAGAGIATMIYYPVPVHRLPPYAGTAPSLPVAEAMAGEVLSLPCSSMLAPAVQEEVAKAIRAAL